MTTQKRAPSPTNLQEQIEEIIDGLRRDVESRIDEWIDVRSAVGFRDFEVEVAALLRCIGDGIAEMVLREILADEEFVRRCSSTARKALQVRGGGMREVRVRLLGGTSVEVSAPYMKVDRRRRPGPRRKSGRRGPNGSGLYPALAALGISFGVTPALAGEIARQVTDSDSVRAGRAALARRGIDLGHKQTLRILNLFGERAVEYRYEWLGRMFDADLPQSGPLSGKRVVVSVDGGRIRERVPKQGRRSRRTGHHRYDAPWREPKLFTIYTIDEKGKVDKTFRPIIDGTMEDCDATFAMLVAYLRGLGCHKAKHLELVGDGALWIWGRVDSLVEFVGISVDRVTEVIDWYHALEALGEVAKVPSWSNSEEQRWLKKAKARLFAGDIEGLMRLFDEIAVGRRAGKINKLRPYFRDNAQRMNYRSAKKAKLPLGSGAVESAIRRVINLRMKGCGTFWLQQHAQAMILFRSYLKTDRFDELFDWLITQHASWSPDQPTLRSPIVEQS